MRILITAGPTQEPIDAVRYIGNRSSGRLGIALAEDAVARGHEVTLLLGPACVLPMGRADALHLERFRTTAELQELLARYWPGELHCLIMTAAVADYRMIHADTQGKLPRGAGSLTLHLESTPDLVAQCALRKKPGQRVIGFALETPENLERRASEKLAKKGLDAVVANPLETMDSPSISGALIWADGRRAVPLQPVLPKREFAAWLLSEVLPHQVR